MVGSRTLWEGTCSTEVEGCRFKCTDYPNHLCKCLYDVMYQFTCSPIQKSSLERRIWYIPANHQCLMTKLSKQYTAANATVRSSVRMADYIIRLTCISFRVLMRAELSMQTHVHQLSNLSSHAWERARTLILLSATQKGTKSTSLRQWTMYTSYNSAQASELASTGNFQHNYNLSRGFRHGATISRTCSLFGSIFGASRPVEWEGA